MKKERLTKGLVVGGVIFTLALTIASGVGTKVNTRGKNPFGTKTQEKLRAGKNPFGLVFPAQLNN